jgi:hypothetical protein
MRAGAWVVLAFVAGLLVASGCFRSGSPIEASKAEAQPAGGDAKWEHKFFVIRFQAFEALEASKMEVEATKQLAEVNAGGWEYSGFNTLMAPGHLFLFKRLKK